MRSDMIKKGDHQAPARSLLHATGAFKQPTDMNKPFVAIVTLILILFLGTFI